MLACLLSTVLGLAQAPAMDEAARTLALLRTPKSELRFDSAGATQRMRLVLPLLQAYAELCGWKLTLEAELAAALAQVETGLQVEGALARDDVHPLVQTIACARGLCFRLMAENGETTLVVERSTGERAPIAIPVAGLSAWANHPAFVLRAEIPHAEAGGAELCQRLGALLAQGGTRTRLVRAESGALAVTGSSAALEFVIETLRESAELAQPLDAATFPPDPNTPEGREAARLPESLRAVFPPREAPLALAAGAAPPSELEIVLGYGRWSARALLFESDATRSALAQASGGTDAPKSVPAGWAHEFVAGLLADSGCALTPLPARRPVLYSIQKHPAGGSVALEPAGVTTIRLDQLAAVAHLAATRFQTFVRLPQLEDAQRRQIGELESPDRRIPFWITELDEPQVFSVIGTPRAISSAVLALRLLVLPPKAR